jgi:predicted transcriptional regulator
MASGLGKACSLCFRVYCTSRRLPSADRGISLHGMIS